MSDDFGTLSARQDPAREIEALRKRYRTHRDALRRLASDAPTEHLANEYAALIADIDEALRKIDELEGRAPTTAELAAAAATSGAPVPRSAAERPLARDLVDEPAPGGNFPRVAMIVGAGLVVLAIIIYLMWHGSDSGVKPVVEQPATSAPADTAAPSTAPPVTPATQTTPVAVSNLSIKITPSINDYGTIRKGTRAVRQFDVTNNSDTPVTVKVARSNCRCLFYDYHDKVEPKKKETITVAVDGARAKAGTLHEVIDVTTKEDPAVSAQFTVQATIK